MSKSQFGALTIFMLVFSSCNVKNRHAARLFVSLSGEKTGISFVNELSPDDSLNILNYLYFYNGGGVSIGDVNNDGLPDVFLISNQDQNKLYLNKGQLQFEDVTQRAGIEGKADWSTGSTMADVNGDGWLDIHVCVVSNFLGLRGHNELYINNQDGTFSESSNSFGINFSDFSTQAAFFDFDQDDDLDMYLLTHAVHTPYSYGKAGKRKERIPGKGDRLLENRDGQFVDISEQAGIYGGHMGYGLGIATSDFNNDGLTDIYVSNDFHENDYFYLNQGDGTFKELVKEYFQHVSQFSMGSDVADVNGDGFMDIMTLDMLAQDEKVLKASMSGDLLDVRRLKTEKMGYHPQHIQNMLQLNQDGKRFVETAWSSGVAATDWSWSVLFSDFTNDGTQDIFISNGIEKRPNDLDYIKFISNEEIKKSLVSSRSLNHEVIKQMPSGLIHNYLYEGDGKGQFKDVSKRIEGSVLSSSTGAAYGDLDGDGDLDIVLNNVNREAQILENKTKNRHSLAVKLHYKDKNLMGMGAKVQVFSEDRTQTRELFTTRGFQSSSEPLLHFGFLQKEKADSLIVLWPNGVMQLVHVPDSCRTLQVLYDHDHLEQRAPAKAENHLFLKTQIPGLEFTHVENSYIDFKRQPTIPYKISDKGPAAAVADFNRDGLEDIAIGQSKHQPIVFYMQDANGFSPQFFDEIRDDSVSEVVSLAAADFNGDNHKDLFAVSAGGEFRNQSPHLNDHIYFNEKEGYLDQAIKSYNSNGSLVKVCDFDEDGDQDLFVGGGYVAGDFGRSPFSVILVNDGFGQFVPMSNPDLNYTGMVTDALWYDFNGDSKKDLIVVGEWMAPTFFQNSGEKFIDVSEEWCKPKLNGLWQQIVAFDVDGDGEDEFVMGNWGLNHKYVATSDFPLRMHYADFMQDGTTETLIASAKSDVYYLKNSLDELNEVLGNHLQKRFRSYREFAGKSADEVFERLSTKSKLYEVHELSSGYLKKMDGTYQFVPFAMDFQVAPVTRFLKHDFDRNGKQDLLLAGNYLGTDTHHGYLNSFQGGMLLGGIGSFTTIELGMDLSVASARGLQIVNFKGEEYLLITNNNGPMDIYKLIAK